MANPKHLDILKQGVETWNHWREETPEIQPNFVEVDFAGKRLTGINLHGADFY